MSLSALQTCIIIGASHGGISAAFSLRKEGWLGKVVIIDTDPALPYHRPPLSKAYLTDSTATQPPVLKPEKSFEKSNISLKLGETVATLDTAKKLVVLTSGETLSYDKLILSTGARPFIPPITGINTCRNVFTLRTKADVENIRAAFNKSEHKRVVIIGGGYIGLETAASLKKLGGKVTVLERESRLLARVTSPEMSSFFNKLHTENGVNIYTAKNVIAMEMQGAACIVTCEANECGTNEFEADIVIVGVGVQVNQELAKSAGIACDNGIKVSVHCQTSKPDIFAIGDCSFHHNQYYDRWLRLESVQNAVDQAKVAAANVCENDSSYDALPWFWSDQFEVKLQMVGLAAGYDNLVIRKETDENKFSVWYFAADRLLAVDAVNHAKAYVQATKALKARANIAKSTLADNSHDITDAIIG